MDPNYLLNVLKGCLYPDTIKQSEQILGQLSLHQQFLQNLLKLIQGQQNNVLMMILATIKNYLTARYKNPQNPIHPSQKYLLRQNLLNFFYQINNNNNAIKLYQQIIFTVISVDYPWDGVHNMINNDLNGQIIASVHFFHQVSKVYEYLIENHRKILEQFIQLYFPTMQKLIENILINYNKQTSDLLYQILQTFYCCFHIDIPIYLRNFDNLSKWILYFKTIIKAPCQTIPLNHRLTSRIFQKLLAMYSTDNNDGKNYKGWGQLFRNRYGQDLYNQILYNLTIVDQQVSATTLKCLYNVCKNKDLRKYITQEHCKGILYSQMLPRMERTSQDVTYFNNDQLQYIRRQQDLTCHPYRQCAYDLIEMIATTLQYNHKPQLIRLIQYSASVLQNNSARQQQKQVILKILTKINSLILKNKYLKHQIENLIRRYFIPILKQGKPFLVVQVCQLLQIYLPHCKMASDSVHQLMGLIYGQMVGNNTVVKYSSILAFTALMEHNQALQAAKPHFQTILQIYVKMVDLMDHQKLLKNLKSVIKNFSTQIGPLACQLIDHLISIFYSQCKGKQGQQANDPQDDYNNVNTASASLSTIKQIIQSPLTSQQYWKISQQILQLLKNIFEQLDGYFQQVINLFNALVYNTNSLVDFQFPYVLFRKLLQGNNSILQNCKLPTQLIELILKQQKADDQHFQTIISILKNLIQKMPQHLLYQYPFPTHPQLLLCLIENKKIPANGFEGLNTSQVSMEWSDILRSYSAIVYGIGMVSEPAKLKIMTGVSLYPWLKDAFGVDIVKKMLFIIEDEEEDDEDFDDENTMQMLERYANQQQQQQQQDFYVSAGINYQYYYKSPFDSDNDKAFMLQRLKNLSQTQAAQLINQLSQSNRKKLETLFNS